MNDQAAQMDAIYRFQRHFYDLTRKPYLLGRDTLIRELAVPPSGTILEIGCLRWSRSTQFRVLRFTTFRTSENERCTLKPS